MESTGWLFSPLFPGRIGIWKCWFLWREENRSTQRETLRAGARTNNKLNPHMMPSPGIEPGPHWWEASALTTAPSLLPCCYKLQSKLFSMEADKGHKLLLPWHRFYSWRDIILLQCERRGRGCREKFKNLKEVCYTLLVC